MKKITPYLSLLLVLSMLLTMASCASNHPINKIAEKINESNYQMTLTLSNESLPTSITQVSKVDGNIMHTSETIFSDEKYTEMIDDVTYYEYSMGTSGRWSKQKVNAKDLESFIDDHSFDDLFDPDNYEKDKEEKGTYKQKKDAVIDGFKDITIFIGDESCTVEMTMLYDGLSFETTMVFSKFGKIHLTLPKTN